MKPEVDPHPPEISDLIIKYDPVSLERQPVSREEVVAHFRTLGRRRAAKIVASMPVDERGVLDARQVDHLLIRVHSEIQRLSEEFQQGQRVLALLKPTLEALRHQGVRGPYRLVDVGCGSGYMVRWLSAFGGLGEDVILLGTDYNAALIEHARQLAKMEGLDCQFEVANAFHLQRPATIYVSIGVLHHFRGVDLVTFFSQQKSEFTQAFLHFDIRSSWLAPMGAWLFHAARMREPLSRHDGVLSAIRAHPSERLLEAAREGLPEFDVTLFDEDHSPIPLFKVMHAIVGFRPHLRAPLLEVMGAAHQRLEPFS